MRTPPLFQSYSFTRSERLALVIIAILSTFICILPGLYRIYKSHFTEGKQALDTAWMEAIEEEPVTDDSDHTNLPEQNPANKQSGVLMFHFDPNKAPFEDLVRLGIREKVAHTIINYRSKGGKFRRKEDLKKIYGLSIHEYTRLADWIQIENTGKVDATDVKETMMAEKGPGPDSSYSAKPRYSKQPFMRKSKWENPEIDINRASAEEWQALRGIGPAYSKRIVNFREKLGGFYSIEQVGETYGVPDSVFQKIKPNLRLSPIFRRIDLNEADLTSLQHHPYISYKEAKVLLAYVQQHAPVTDLAQLRDAMLKIFTKERWEKLEPYLNLHN